MWSRRMKYTSTIVLGQATKQNKEIVESHHKVQTAILALTCNLKMYQEKQVNHKNEKESQS